MGLIFQCYDYLLILATDIWRCKQERTSRVNINDSSWHLLTLQKDTPYTSELLSLKNVTVHCFFLIQCVLTNTMLTYCTQWKFHEPSCPMHLPKIQTVTAILTSWNGWYLDLKTGSVNKNKQPIAKSATITHVVFLLFQDFSFELEHLREVCEVNT